jgi:hypothetical protein
MLALVLFLKSPVYTQDSLQTASAINLDLSTGLGAVEDFAYTFTMEIRLREQHQLITLQILYSKEFGNSLIPLIDQREYSSPREEILNVALLYGRAYSFHFHQIFPPFVFFQQETDYSVYTNPGWFYKCFRHQHGDGWDEDQVIHQ